MSGLSFSKPSEVVALLCERLKKERLVQTMTQADLAARAGVGVNTISSLEAGRSVSLETVVRVAMVLGRLGEIEILFKPKIDSLEDIMRYENSAARIRARQSVRHD